MPQKNKPLNLLTFRTNANPDAKCKKQKRGAKREKSDAQK